LALGGDLEPETLLLAYRHGIFPWPWGEQYPLAWFSPPRRGVLFFEELHIPARLQRLFRQGRFETTINASTANVIHCCAAAENRRGGAHTWITPQMIEAYCQLANLGHVVSAESWFNGELVGGIYGVKIGRFFAGESMFYRQANASKVALLALILHLQQLELSWIDCQQCTAHMAQFGAREIERNEFLSLLNGALST